MIAFSSLNLNIPSPASTSVSRCALSVSSTNYRPRESLINPTQARIHDRMAWEAQYALSHRERFYVPPTENDTYVPSTSLLTTTEARNNDARAWNEHVQHLKGTEIKTNFSPVADHVLRLTKARIQEIFILQERARAKQECSHPLPPRYVTSSFMPSEHLLSTTKARQLDALALQTHQAQAHFCYSADAVMQLPPLSEHLLLPTQANIAANQAWIIEKQQAEISKDIWWEQRRPTPCSDYHHRYAHRLPSKVTEMTVSYAVSIRGKFVDEQMVVLTQETNVRLALSTKYQQMPSISLSSHLLTSTSATTHCAWSALNHSATRQAQSLVLPSKKTYPYQAIVRSRLYATTSATRAHRFMARKRIDYHRNIRRMTETDTGVRLLRPTRAVLLSQTSVFTGKIQDAREAHWNVHTTRGRIAENPFENGWKLVPRHRGVSSHASRSTKHISWTSTEVRTAVARAVNAALQEIDQQKKHQEEEKEESSQPKKKLLFSDTASVSSKTSMSISSNKSAATTNSQMSTMSKRAQEKAQRREENPFPSSLKKSTLWSSPAKKLSPATTTSTGATTTSAKKKNACSPPTSRRNSISPEKANKHEQVSKKKSLQVAIIEEDKKLSLQEKLATMMMLSPVHRDAQEEKHQTLVFEDLSDCISPMSTCDQEESFVAEKSEDEWPLWNLSAATVDQHEDSTGVVPRLSVETAELYPKSTHQSTKSRPNTPPLQQKLVFEAPMKMKEPLGTCLEDEHEDDEDELTVVGNTPIVAAI